MKGYQTHEVLVSSVPKKVKKAINGEGRLPLYQGRVSGVKTVKVGGTTDAFLCVDWSTVTPYKPESNVISLSQLPLGLEDDSETIKLGFETYTRNEFTSYFRGVRCYSCSELLPFTDGNVAIDVCKDLYCCVDCSAVLLDSELQNLKG